MYFNDLLYINAFLTECANESPGDIIKMQIANWVGLSWVSVGRPPGWRHFFCFVFSSPVPFAHSFSVKHGSPQRENVFLTTVVLFYFLPHLSNFFFLPVSTTYVCCTRKPHCPPDDWRNHQFLSCPSYTVSRHKPWQGLPQLSLKLLFFLIW